MFEIKNFRNVQSRIYRSGSVHADHFSTGGVPNRVMCDSDVDSCYLGSVRRSQRIKRPQNWKASAHKRRVQRTTDCFRYKGIDQRSTARTDNKGVDALFLSSSSILSSVERPPSLPGINDGLAEQRDSIHRDPRFRPSPNAKPGRPLRA